VESFSTAVKDLSEAKRRFFIYIVFHVCEIIETIAINNFNLSSIFVCFLVTECVFCTFSAIGENGEERLAV
jgi:hypothetical protein